MASPTNALSAAVLYDKISDVCAFYFTDVSRIEIKDLDHDPQLSAAIVPLLREWLQAKGISESQANKASPYVLVNALRGGDRYIDKMRQNDAFAPPKPARGGRNFARRVEDLAVDLDGPIGAQRDYGNGPSYAERVDRVPTVTMPLIEKPADHVPALPETFSGTHAAIARAADEVLSRKVVEAERRLQSAMKSEATVIQDRLGQALDRRWTEAEVHFAERTKTLVRDTQQMVVDIADRLIPRELVVRTNTVERTLPAEIRHEAFDRILKWLLVGEHVYIVGPAGTGKTHMAKQLATAIGKELFLPGQALSKYDISGYKGPTGEYFGTVVRDALERGGLLFVDEGDMWAAAALGFLNAPLANGWASFPDRTIEVHPEFQCMIAANTYGRGATQEYIGRNPLDAASVDRFAFETVDYDEDMERLLYGNSPWVQYVHRVRAAVRDLKLRHVVSTRAIQRVLRGVQADLPVENICSSALWRGLDPDTVLKIKSQAGEPPRVLVPVEDDDEDDLADGTNS